MAVYSFNLMNKTNESIVFEYVHTDYNSRQKDTLRINASKEYFGVEIYYKDYGDSALKYFFKEFKVYYLNTLKPYDLRKISGWKVQKKLELFGPHKRGEINYSIELTDKFFNEEELKVK